MHIEPGVVDGAKIAFSVVTGAGALALTGKMAWNTIRHDGGLGAFAIRSAIASAAILGFFELLPHYPVGVSEVHFILGSTLLLMFGAGPAAIGMTLGLLVQALFLSPIDLPQYGMNLSSLIFSLYAISLLAQKIIPARTAYADVSYGQALALSTAFQGGIVAWVAFWSFYGQGFGVASSVASFGAAYMMVILAEPLIDLAVLAAAKTWRGKYVGVLFTNRMHAA